MFTWAGLEVSLSKRGFWLLGMTQLLYLIHKQNWDWGTRENGGCMLSCWNDGQIKEWREVTSDSRIRHKWQHLRFFPRRNCTTFYEKWQFCLNNPPPLRWVGRRLRLIGKIVFLSTGLRLGIDSEWVALSNGMGYFSHFCGRWNKVKWLQLSIQALTGHIDTSTMGSSLTGEPKP